MTAVSVQKRLNDLERATASPALRHQCPGCGALLWVLRKPGEPDVCHHCKLAVPAGVEPAFILAVVYEDPRENVALAGGES